MPRLAALPEGYNQVILFDGMVQSVAVDVHQQLCLVYRAASELRVGRRQERSPMSSLGLENEASDDWTARMAQETEAYR